ncbi:hypothetical protein CEXT_170711 [Caerostris extrusa]|uniref:Uncharacterized protein n=1 Tax=Caerostris extrusa TaxID=172846 RepID=A0AAV4NNM6_CAEEX|nr:hypothetical protein CEXT_170711 [Caerostris extrusa]
MFSFLPFKAVEGGSNAKLQRAMSCDSVCSDTSVVLDTLESPQNNGELEITLEYSILGHSSPFKLSSVSFAVINCGMSIITIVTL